MSAQCILTSMATSEQSFKRMKKKGQRLFSKRLVNLMRKQYSLRGINVQVYLFLLLLLLLLWL